MDLGSGHFGYVYSKENEFIDFCTEAADDSSAPPSVQIVFVIVVKRFFSAWENPVEKQMASNCSYLQLSYCHT